MSSFSDRATRKSRLIYAGRIGPSLSRWRRGSVAMIHIGRSGSSVLGRLMKQHPSIFWEGEIYQTELNARGLTAADSVSMGMGSMPPLDLTSMVRRSGPLIYGFEVKFFHLDLFGISYEGFARSLQVAGVSQVVILERRNHLAKIVSSVRAQSDGFYHVPADNENVQKSGQVSLGSGISIDYTTGSVLEYLERYAHSFASMREVLAQTDLPVLELTYEEDIQDDPAIAYVKACEHLGITPRNPKVTLRRPSSTGIDAAIADANVIREQLRDTEFAWMLS